MKMKKRVTVNVILCLAATWILMVNNCKPPGVEEPTPGSKTYTIQENPSAGGDCANSIALDANYLYVAGWDYSPGNDQWRIEKRDKDTGALVSAFDGDGVVESDPSTYGDRAKSIAVDDSYIAAHN